MTIKEDTESIQVSPRRPVSTRPPLHHGDLKEKHSRSSERQTTHKRGERHDNMQTRERGEDRLKLLGDDYSDGPAERSLNEKRGGGAAN